MGSNLWKSLNIQLTRRFEWVRLIHNDFHKWFHTVRSIHPPGGPEKSGRSMDTAPMIFPPPVEAFDELKQALTLSEAQVRGLRQTMQERNDATPHFGSRLRKSRTS